MEYRDLVLGSSSDGDEQSPSWAAAAAEVARAAEVRPPVRARLTRELAPDAARARALLAAANEARLAMMRERTCMASFWGDERRAMDGASPVRVHRALRRARWDRRRAHVRIAESRAGRPRTPAAMAAFGLLAVLRARLEAGAALRLCALPLAAGDREGAALWVARAPLLRQFALDCGLVWVAAIEDADVVLAAARRRVRMGLAWALAAAHAAPLVELRWLWESLLAGVLLDVTTFGYELPRRAVLRWGGLDMAAAQARALSASPLPLSGVAVTVDLSAAEGAGDPHAKRLLRLCCHRGAAAAVLYPPPPEARPWPPPRVVWLHVHAPRQAPLVGVACIDLRALCAALYESVSPFERAVVTAADGTPVHLCAEAIDAARSPPTYTPTIAPTIAPTYTPTLAPTLAPTISPTVAPTLAPTISPTVAPTVAPTTSTDVTPPRASPERRPPPRRSLRLQRVWNRK